MLTEPCVFGDLDHPPPVVPATAPVELDVPLVLTDLSVPPADVTTLVGTARRLAPSCDALLVGDHQDRPDFPPTVLARLIAEAGGRPWVTLACRDRNRVVLEQELAGLRLDGRATVLCVTGDGRAYDVRPEVTQVFDLDGIRLTGLAAATGLPVAVAETPNAPPLRLRPERLVRKQQAGAGVGVLNHVRTAGQVAEFVAAARGLGLTMPVVASVAVYTDERSAAVLTALPGLEIDPVAVRDVLAAPDPVEAGIATPLAQAEALLPVPGVAGGNLSGLASAPGVRFAPHRKGGGGVRSRAGARPTGGRVG